MSHACHGPDLPGLAACARRFLENHCGGNVTVGSNPTPSALTCTNVPGHSCKVRWAAGEVTLVTGRNPAQPVACNFVEPPGPPMCHHLPGHHDQRYQARNHARGHAGNLPFAPARHRRRYCRDRAGHDPGQPDRRRRDDRRDSDRQPGLGNSLVVGRTGHPPVRGTGRRPGRGRPRPGAPAAPRRGRRSHPHRGGHPGHRRGHPGRGHPARGRPGTGRHVRAAAGPVRPRSSPPRSSAAPSWSPCWRVSQASRCPP